MRALDHVDDLIEDKMRETYVRKIKGPSELVKEFVNTQSISELHTQTVVSKDTWDYSSEISLDIKTQSKGIFKTNKIGKNLKSILKIDKEYKKQRKVYENKLEEFIKYQ